MHITVAEAIPHEGEKEADGNELHLAKWISAVFACSLFSICLQSKSQGAQRQSVVLAFYGSNTYI